MAAPVAWLWESDDEGGVVFATTRNKARYQAAYEMGCDYVDAEVTRYPDADRFASQTGMGTDDYLSLGWSMECYGCSTRVSNDDEDGAYEWVDGNLYCLACAIDHGFPCPEGAMCVWDEWTRKREYRDKTVYIYEDGRSFTVDGVRPTPPPEDGARDA